MIDRLISGALNHRLATAGVVFLLIGLGVWSVLNLSIDSFPDVSNVQVQIITEPETMATQEVEQQITFPIENGLNGLPKINKIRSNSSFGLSVVTAIFDDDTDVYFARQLVQQRLSQIELPAGAPQPMLGPVVSSFSQVYMYYLKSDKLDLTDLRTLQDWTVARKLRSVPGVGNVVSYGGFVKQYQVFVNPAKLRGYGLTLKEVIDALPANNLNAGGNFIEQGGQEIIIRGLGRINSADDIEAIVLKSVNGTPVTFAQVAEVKIGPAFRRGAASMNGEGEAVTGFVLTRKGVNTKAVVEKVREKIHEIQAELPEGVSITPYYDQTELVDKTIETVKEILLFSSGLVIVILFAVLLHIRSALIVSVVIPLSLLFSFVMMKLTGLSANLMTLGAVDFGVVVDAAVVVVENIFRHLSHAHEHADAKGVKVNHLSVVMNATKEVGKPITFAIFIIVAVYVPLFSLEGVEGKMFSPLALTFIYAILGALVLALTIVPVLCVWFLKGKVVEKDNPILGVAQKIHEPALAAAIAKPIPVAIIALVALVASIIIVPFLGSEFIPSLDEGPILLRTKLAPSVALTESQRVAQQIESVIKEFPETTVVVSKIGRSGMGSDLEGVDNADVYIGLKPKSQWTGTKNKEELVNQMAAKINNIPGLLYSFSQPIADMIDDLISGIKADLGIKVFGDDPRKIDEIAGHIESICGTVRGSADIQREQILGLPQLNIRLNRREIARYGLNVAEVQEIISTAVAGRVVTEVLEDTKRFGLLVRYPAKFRDSVVDLERIAVTAPNGAIIPLRGLADMRIEDGIVMMNREDGQRRTAVLVNVRGRDLGSFVAEVQEKVKKEITLPKGYRLVYGGQFENQQRAMERFAVVVPAVLLLIFVLLYASFNSLKNAALIMLNVPFAMIGGIIALLLTRQTLSVPAIIGFIALSGVAVQNGVILVSYIMQLQKRGQPVASAAIEGARVRLRPVLMTALVAIVGLLPKVMSDGTGAEVQRPLATVVLGGLVSATILTLVVLPAFYKLINKDDSEKTSANVSGETHSHSGPDGDTSATALTGSHSGPDEDSPAIELTKSHSGNGAESTSPHRDASDSEAPSASEIPDELPAVGEGKK
ncbi:MAG: CusA/CzcA family heavy metal efflux RND transporter [Candidatus Obscuribacterales bacterium]|jgi:cobalt-zinc-cadmium resistance protein CzcA|nr:CusA/CzcA family heavy metal efflux RND transporter [Candidatus Obscuribacterales bacterium]